MKLFVSIIICKFFRLILRIIGRGSSFPGQLVLKLYPDILKRIVLPKNVIAVSGSNGKTSTVELINNILITNGYKVAYNYEGSNQIEGITTLLLNDCSIDGKCKSDIALLEIDERYLYKIFKYITPTYFIVTNLFRDQQTRNGNREWVYNCIKESIKNDMCLILNADDPLTSLLSKSTTKSVFYGMNCNDVKYIKGVFDDGIYCPNCYNKLIYKYRYFDNLGSFYCNSCGYKKAETKYSVTKLDLNNSKMFIDNEELLLSFPSIYNAYNNLAAFSLASELNIDRKLIIKSLNNYILKNKRIVSFKLNNKNGIFLASKHENPVSYNQSMTFISDYKKDVSLIIVVDKISRKYFTSETSWLWDIDFSILNVPNVKNIILSGTYAYDLALRFEYCDLDKSKIVISKDISEGIDKLSKVKEEDIFIVTCFADQNNVLRKVEEHD